MEGIGPLACARAPLGLRQAVVGELSTPPVPVKGTDRKAHHLTFRGAAPHDTHAAPLLRRPLAPGPSAFVLWGGPPPPPRRRGGVGGRARPRGAQVTQHTGLGDQLVSDYKYMYCRRWGDVQVRVAPLELRRFNT